MMRRACRTVTAVLLATLFAAAALLAQSDAVPLERLQTVLDQKVLNANEIAEILLDVGVAFRLNDSIERDLRDRGANDLIILAVRNGYRSPLPAAPALRQDLLNALASGAGQDEIAEHIRRYGVGADIDWQALAPLRDAGAGPDVLRLVAERWLEAGSPEGSVEEIEAVLAAGAAPRLLGSRLANAPLKFTLDAELAERLRQSGADDPFLADLARRALQADAGRALDLETVELYLGLGVEPSLLARGLEARGSSFAVSPEDLDRLREAGADDGLIGALLVASLNAGSEPLSLDEVVRAMQAGAAAEPLTQALTRRGADFGFVPSTTARFVEDGVSDEARLAVIRYLLEKDEYRELPAKRAFNFDPQAVEGSLDLRLMADHVVEVVIVDSLILTKALRGSPSKNEGSEYSQGIPRDLEPGSFEIERRDGRGEFAPYWLPSADNGYIFRVRLYDEKGGADRVHLHLTWRRAAAN